MAKDPKQLKVWQLADRLVMTVYRATTYLPSEERYGLTSQMRRAAVSVVANVSEGAGRRTQQDFLHFLYMASASLNELEYYIHLIRQLDYVPVDITARLAQQRKETARTLQGLISKIEEDLP